MFLRIKRASGWFLAALIALLFLYYNFVKPRWKYIIIHHSSTRLGSVRIFRNGHEERGGAWPFNDPMFYHLVIGNGHGSGDGELERGRRWLRQQLGGGCCSLKGLDRVERISDLPLAFSDYYNYTGIHICLVGEFSKNPPSGAQISTLCPVVEKLCRRYRIPPERILGHRDVQMAPTDCPGRAFPMERFRRQIERRLNTRLEGRKVSLFTWRITLVNLWPVLGFFFGEYYFATALLLFNLFLAFLFIKAALPLLRARPVSLEEEEPETQLLPVPACREICEEAMALEDEMFSPDDPAPEQMMQPAEILESGGNPLTGQEEGDSTIPVNRCDDEKIDP